MSSNSQAEKRKEEIRSSSVSACVVLFLLHGAIWGNADGFNSRQAADSWTGFRHHRSMCAFSCVDSPDFCLSARLPFLSHLCACGENTSVPVSVTVWTLSIPSPQFACSGVLKLILTPCRVPHFTSFFLSWSLYLLFLPLAALIISWTSDVCVCVWASLPSPSPLCPSVSSSCRGASSSTPLLSQGRVAGPAPAAAGTCPSGNTGARARNIHFVFPSLRPLFALLAPVRIEF